MFTRQPHTTGSNFLSRQARKAAVNRTVRFRRAALSFSGMALLLFAAPAAAQQAASPDLFTSDAGYYTNLPAPASGPVNACLLRAVPQRQTGALPRAVPQLDADTKGNSIEERGDAEWGRLAYPTDRLPPGDWRGRAIAHIQANIPESAPPATIRSAPPTPGAVIVPGVTWTKMGPMPLDNNAAAGGYKYGIVNGRFNAVAFQPGSATIAYAGASVGGLWKTTNCCTAATTWTPLWDGTTFPAQSVGAIAVDPVNPNIIYVGTGDSQVPGHGDAFGNGIYKSLDGGATWTQYGANVFSPYTSPGAPGSACCVLAPDQNITWIRIHPNNRNTILAGASFGLFISYDAGVTWTQYDVVNRNLAPYTTSAQRVTGLLVDGPTNTMYVAIGYPYTTTRRPGLTGGANGMYKATVPVSGAPVFTQIVSGWPAGTGSGTENDVGRIEIDWDSTHTHIYAHVSDYGFTSLGANIGDTLGIWHTANGGATWNLLTGSTGASFIDCGGAAESLQAWYDLYLGVDPLNSQVFYTGRTNLWKGTVDPTYTSVVLQDLSGVYTQLAACGYGTCHPDQHAIAFQPASNPTRFLAANDGGLYYGTGANGGFTQLNNSMDTLQFYAGQLGRDFANPAGTQYAFGGYQDNGSASWDSSNASLQWQARGNGGDGFFGSFDPLTGTRTTGPWYTEYTNGAMSCSNGGAGGAYAACAPPYAAAEREDWSTPFLLDQWNCSATRCGNMIVGSTVIWASTTAYTCPPAWTSAGTTDLTKNVGRYSQIISNNIAHSNPGSVIVGTGDGNVQWSNNVFTGANCTLAASNTATFACAVNGGATWVNLTGGNAVLPNRAIGGVAFDPTTDLIVYAAVAGFNTNTPATPGHIFRGVCAASPCTAANITWTNKSGALPDVPFEGMAVNPNKPNQVFAGSFLGFFYTDDITAASPVWTRYQSGLPNTRVRFLTTDRGPTATPRASTTLAAFTFGRGLYTTQVNLPPACSPPSVPTGLTGTPACAGVNLNWTAAAGATSYNILRGATCAAVAPLGTSATTNYSDATAVSGTNYFYAVQSVAGCVSTTSACVGPLSTSAAGAPTTPAASSNSCSTITASWTNGVNATSHNLLRYNGACPPTGAATTFTGVTSPYTDSAVTRGSSYCYVAQAVNGCGTANAVGATGTAAAYQDFHFQVQNTFVAGYKDMTNAAGFEAALQQQATANITTPGEYQIGAVPLQWISPAYAKNTDLASGPWTFDVYGLTANAGAAGQLYAKVFRYNAGAPVLLFTTGYAATDISTASAQTRFTWTYTPAATTLATGDRLIAQVWVHATAGSTGSTTTVADLANADASAVQGTVTGTFTDTQVCDALTQNITEVRAGGIRQLDHVWSFALTTGTAHVFNAVAWTSSATQQISLQWGTTVTGPWTPMFNVAQSASPGCATPLTFTLPAAQTGTIYIHAVTVAPDGVNDTLFVDSMKVVTTINTPAPFFTLNYDFASADTLITAADCAGVVAVKPPETSGTVAAALKASKGSTLGTVVLNFEDVTVAGVTGYNAYEGNMPFAVATPYTHGSAPGNVCNVATTLVAGRRTTPAAGIGTAGSHYYLITAFNTTLEGPSGYNSAAVEIPPAMSTCAP